MVRGFSSERRLPLFFTGLLALVVGGFVVVGYREVRSSAVTNASERLQGVTGLLVDMFTNSARQLLTNARQIAERPAIRAYLRAPLSRGRAEALAALQPTAGQAQTVAVELWDANGTRVLTTRADLPPLEGETAQSMIRALAPAESAAIGRIRQVRDTLIYPIVSAVTEREQHLGYVVQLRRVAVNSQGARLLAELIGSHATTYVGNADGHLWTDFTAVVAGPPADVLADSGVVEYERPDAGAFMAVPARIPNTPWMVAVEFPRGPVVGPARVFLLRMGLLGVVLVAAGAAAAWGMSLRVRGLTRALHDSEALLRGITDTAHDAIVAADDAGRITYWNPGAARMFGYTPADVLGQPLQRIMPERHQAAHAAGIRRYVAGGAARVVGRTVELEGRRKDGTEFPLELSLAAARTAGGMAFTGVIRDITDRKRTEQALHETNAELEAFAYSVSHDLRAPLRAIHGFGQMLLEDHGANLDQEARRLLSVMSDNTKKMGQLIDDLLTFSRLARKEPDAARVDMTELMRTVAEEVRRAEGDRVLEIAIAPLPPAHGDRQLLRQAVANLLQNAAKFTRGRPDARVEVSAQTDGGQPVYVVKDNGAGFDARYAHKLFGVFQRLHSDEQFEGTGVGLAIVQRIVHRHGGRVWAEGEVNRGATFYFTIPGAT